MGTGKVVSTNASAIVNNKTFTLTVNVYANAKVVTEEEIDAYYKKFIRKN